MWGYSLGGMSGLCIAGDILAKQVLPYTSVWLPPSSPCSREDVPEHWTGSFWGQFACPTSIRWQGQLWLLGMVDFPLQTPD